MPANLANDSNTSRQIKETSRSIGYTAQPAPGEAASPWQAICTVQHDNLMGHSVWGRVGYKRTLFSDQGNVDGGSGGVGWGGAGGVQEALQDVRGWILPPWEGGPVVVYFKVRKKTLHINIYSFGGRSLTCQAKLANCSNVSRQLKETSGVGASTARPTTGKAALPWQAMSM